MRMQTTGRGDPARWFIQRGGGSARRAVARTCAWRRRARRAAPPHGRGPLTRRTLGSSATRAAAARVRPGGGAKASPRAATCRGRVLNLPAAAPTRAVLSICVSRAGGRTSGCGAASCLWVSACSCRPGHAYPPPTHRPFGCVVQAGDTAGLLSGLLSRARFLLFALCFAPPGISIDIVGWSAVRLFFFSLFASSCSTLSPVSLLLLWLAFPRGTVAHPLASPPCARSAATCHCDCSWAPQGPTWLPPGGHCPTSQPPVVGRSGHPHRAAGRRGCPR